MNALLEPHDDDDRAQVHDGEMIISTPPIPAPEPEDSAPGPAPTQHHPYAPMAALAEWNSAFGVRSFIEEDAYGRAKGIGLRLRLIAEEMAELSDELLDGMNGAGNMTKVAKELADLLYVAYGTAAYFDLPIYEVFDAVHASNMSKLDADGKPVRRADGKVLKSRLYREAEPEIATILGVSN